MEHRARKRFGQHFLHDPGVIRRILDAFGPQPDEIIVEIGPGLGALTRPLLERIRQLHVVELDRDLVARLRSEYPPERLQVHQADALEFDFCALVPHMDVPVSRDDCMDAGGRATPGAVAEGWAVVMLCRRRAAQVKYGVLSYRLWRCPCG